MEEEQARLLAELLRAFAHPTRLRILHNLCAEPLCVKNIEEILPFSQANVSQHLSILRHARLVDYCQRGTLRCYYILRPSMVERLFALLDEDHPVVKRSCEQIAKEKATKAESHSETASEKEDTRPGFEQGAKQP
ncbi:MAG: winged helix-turn-helix transcriptional regulator [Planctomycetes bacterium]|nr:winged helix-turn-helix transcriptional regulator [Planctomycetota bacterium]